MVDISQCAITIREANDHATRYLRPYGVAWHQGAAQWAVYDFIDGTQGMPEFVCFGTGKLPTPLNDHAEEALASLLESALRNVTQKRSESALETR